jgi:N-methylhydantoinase A
MDLRYVGQEHTLSLTIGEGFDIEETKNAFNQLHRARYGHAMDSKIQALNLRVKGIGHLSSPKIQSFPSGDGKIERALIGERNCFDFATKKRMSYKIYDRINLMPGDQIKGPALIDEGTSVTVIPSDCKCSVDTRKYLSIRKA